MTKKRPQVALVYDFDGTLSPGNMQEFGFIQATGKTKDEFWEKNRKFAEGKDANGILTYMYLMLDEAKKNNISLMCSANYSKGSVMNIIVKRILDKIKADFEFDRLIELNQKKAWK